MIEIINKIANAILFLFCIWAVLEKRCKTQVIGTLVLSLVAISAFMNVIRPESLGLLAVHFEVMVNVVVALAVSWYWLRWRKVHNACTKGEHVSD